MPVQNIFMKTYPLYLNGEFVTTGRTLDIINPADGTVFAKVSTIDRSRVAAAVNDAHAAYASWRGLTAKARGEFLHKIADQVEQRRDEFARMITMEAR